MKRSVKKRLRWEKNIYRGGDEEVKKERKKKVERTKLEKKGRKKEVQFETVHFH